MRNPFLFILCALAAVVLIAGGDKALPSPPGQGEAAAPGMESRQNIDAVGTAFERATALFDKGDYNNAAALFQETMRQGNVDPALYERAARKAADCYHRLGQHLAAVDHYKYILRQYPDPREGNDEVYLRLVVSYETLKFYHEAVAASQNLLKFYPTSAHGPEALFRLASDLALIGRYEQAAERYEEYLKGHKDGTFVKAALLGLASASFNLGRYDKAAEIFRSYLKQWPAYQEVPQEALFQMGVTAFQVKEFPEAVEFLSSFVSLYPQEPRAGKALYLLGRSLAETGRVKAAAAVLSLLLDRHPNGEEARRAVVYLAALGMRHPQVRVPLYLTGHAPYTDPLGACEGLLSSSFLPRDLEEEVRYHIGGAFLQKGRSAEALAADMAFLRRFPEGPYAKEVRGRLRETAVGLLKEKHAAQDHLAVAALYFRTAPLGIFGRDEAETLLEVADSLGVLSLREERDRLLNYLRTAVKDKKILARLAEAVKGPEKTPGGDFENNEEVPGDPAAFEEALQKTQGEGRRWIIYRMGRSLAKKGDWEGAEKVFSRLKEGTADPFWTKLGDHCLAEVRWRRAHPDL